MRKSFFIILLISTFFISCQNFLDGSNLKESIDKEILIASSSRPEILSVEPKLVDGGVFSDSTIIVSFSKKMSPAFLSDFSNILITDSQGVNLTAHYLNPSVSEDGLTLTIPHNPNNYIPVEEGKLRTIKVTIKNTVSDTETIPLKNDYSWTFNVNTKKDDKEPEFLTGTTVQNSTSVAALTPGSFETILNSVGESNFFSETYHSNSVNINIKCTDAGSGIDKLIVKETLLYTTDGGDVKSQNTNFETEYSDFTKDDAIYTFSVNHKLTNRIPDGIIELSLIIVDKCGNKATRIYPFVKDTDLDINYEKTFADEANPYVSPSESNNYFAITSITPSFWMKWNNKVYNDSVTIKKVVLLDKSKKELQSAVCVSTAGKYLYKFQDIDITQNYYINSVFEDSLGNQISEFIEILEAPLLTNFIKNSTKFMEFTNMEDHFIVYYGDQADQLVNKAQKNHYAVRIPDDIPENNYFSVRFEYVYYENRFGFFSKVRKTPDVIPTYSGNLTNTDFTVSTSLETQDSVFGMNFNIHIKDNIFAKNGTNIIQLRAENYGKTEIATTTANKSIFIPLNELKYMGDIRVGLKILNENEMVESYAECDPLTNEYTFNEDQWIKIGVEKILIDYSMQNDIFSPEIDANQYCLYLSKGEKDKKNNHTTDAPALFCTVKNTYSETIDSLLNANGNLPVSIYWTEAKEYNLSLSEILLTDYINLEIPLNNNSPVQEITVPLTQVINKIKDSENKNFDIYVLIKDSAENIATTKVTYYSFRDDTYSVIYANKNSYNENFNEYIFSKIQFNDNDWNSFYYFNIDDYSFENKRDYNQDSVEIWPNDGVYSLSAPRALNFFTFEKDKFIMLYRALSYENKSLNYSPYYVYTSKTTCNTKNIIQSGNLLTILHDKPVLVHTVICPVNFGDDVRSWESWTGLDYKLNETVINANSLQFDNYTFPSKNEIPEGWYYAAIIYFADNTYTISNVFKN